MYLQCYKEMSQYWCGHIETVCMLWDYFSKRLVSETWGVKLLFYTKGRMSFEIVTNTGYQLAIVLEI